MYFFKADISSFDDEAETVFIIPEQNADENGVPFEEKMITQTGGIQGFREAHQNSACRLYLHAVPDGRAYRRRLEFRKIRPA